MKRDQRIKKRKSSQQKSYFIQKLNAWLGKYLLTIISLGSLYVSLYMLSLAEYNLRRSAVYIERTSVENFVASGNLEAALRRYKSASLAKLRNEPAFLCPLTWIPLTWMPLRYDMPNREPLWILIRSALNRHARAYVIEGIPAFSPSGYSSNKFPGTPDKYLGINLAYADLRGVKLSGCDFTLIDLYRADLRGADLRGSDFSRAFLLETDLRNCDLRSFPGETNQPAQLNSADDNNFLYEKTKSQFVLREQKDLENNHRCRKDSAKVDSNTVLK